MTTIHLTVTGYRRLLMLAAVSPILAGIAAYRLEAGNVWPWVVALPVVLGGWVTLDARRARDHHSGYWTAFAILPGALWVSFLLASWLLPA